MPREPAFRTCDLNLAQAHMCGAFGEHRASYVSREHNLDFQLRRAKVGPIAANSLQYGGGVMISDARLRRYYLLQFTLSGECQFWQNGRQIILPAQSIAIINPGRNFNKMWLPESRQLVLQIDERVVQREFCARTGSAEAAGIEFDQSPIETMANADALVRFVRMLCDDLVSETSDLSQAYLRAMRLELARADLANGGREGGSSVAAVANACGFRHLGRFARDYRMRFGELPSETLQRASVGRAR